jgi:hypothetical protein
MFGWEREPYAVSRGTACTDATEVAGDSIDQGREFSQQASDSTQVIVVMDSIQDPHLPRVWFEDNGLGGSHPFY